MKKSRVLVGRPAEEHPRVTRRNSHRVVEELRSYQAPRILWDWGRTGYARRPPWPRQATSQPETRYRARIGGSTKSTTLGLAERKHPGADTTGVSPE